MLLVNASKIKQISTYTNGIVGNVITGPNNAASCSIWIKCLEIVLFIQYQRISHGCFVVG